MEAAIKQSNLVSRLQVMRGRVRRRLVVYGLLAVLAGGYAAFLTVLTLDWWLRFPGWIRVFVTALFSGGFVGSVYYWIIRPLRSPLSLEALAGRLERHFPRLRDRLTSTVSFLNDPTDASPALVQRLVSNTESIVARTPLENALTIKPLTRSATAFVAISVIMTGFVLGRPHWIGTGLQRYLDPFGPHNWPTRVEIVPLSFDSVVPVGESTGVMMRVTRGNHPDLRALLYMEDAAGRVSVQAMQPGEDGGFVATVDAISGDLRYWFAAGDDTTEDEPFAIRAIRRPVVLEAKAIVTPPPYAYRTAPTVRNFGDGPVTATLGGLARIEIRSSKPLVSDSDGVSPGGISSGGTSSGSGWLRLQGDENSNGTIPLTVDPEQPDRLFAEFSVDRSLRFAVVLEDADGFQNLGGQDRTLLAVADQAPVVSLEEPVASIETTPSGIVNIRGWIEDDFGLTDATVDATVTRRHGLSDRFPAGQHAEKTSVDDGIRFSLRDTWIPVAESSHQTQRDGGNAAGRPLSRPVDDKRVTHVRIDHEWALETYAFNPGDVITFELIGLDNLESVADENGGGTRIGPQEGRSGGRRILIVSATEFETRIRDDVVQLERHLRRALLTQRALRDETQAQVERVTAGQQMTTAEREQLASIGARQGRVGKRLRELADRFDALHERMRQAAMSGEQSAVEMKAHAEALRNLADKPVDEAAERVRNAYERKDQSDRAGELELAVTRQEEAAAGINKLVKDMSEWGSFRTLLTKARDMLQRQADLRAQTQAAGKDMLGKRVDSLSPSEKSRLASIKRMQTQLGEELAQLLDGMKRLSTTEAEKDPSGAEASEDALRTAKAHDVERHVKDAAEAVEQNRTAAATVAQKRVERALSKTLAALEKRETRELLRLTKKSREARELVEILIADVRALRAATAEVSMMDASGKDIQRLVEEQRRLRANAGSIAVALARTDELDEAARLMGEVDEPMAQAVERLADNTPEAAVNEQDAVLEILEEVLASLLAVEEEAEQEVFRRTIDQVRGELVMLSGVQSALNDRLAKLAEAVAARGRVGRSDAREATRIAREEKELQIALQELLPELEAAEVYQWALQGVDEWMGRIHDELIRRDVSYEIVRTGERIVGRLEQLIVAIDQTLALPTDREFEDSQSGGSGGQGGAGPEGGTPLPKVTELLLLKSLQLDINKRTRELHGTMDSSGSAGKHLDKLSEIAGDQEELRRLAERVTGRARKDQR